MRMGFSSVLLHAVGGLVRLGLSSVIVAGCWSYVADGFE